jgi:hypothetical protein
MIVDTAAKLQRTDSPRMFAVTELVAYIRMAVGALLAVAAIMVASRRLSGALEMPLGSFQLFAAGAVLAGLAQVARAPAPIGLFYARGALVSLTMAVIAASVSLLGTNLAALAGFWIMIVGEELWAWRSLLHWARRFAKSVSRIGRPSASALNSDDAIEELEAAEPGDDILQQLTLRSDATGTQELSGWLRLRLATGQRNGNLHVAFCPSFDSLPQVQAEAVSGPDCRVKAAQVLSHGARLDIKLDKPAEQGESVLVWFRAAKSADLSGVQ